MIGLAPISAQAKAKAGEVTHVVLFWLKRPGNIADQNIVMRASKTLRRVRGLKELRVGRAMPVERRGIEQPYDVGLVMVFKDDAALAAFVSNPRHVRLLQAVSGPLLRRREVYNFASE